ncbi:hypothetical protein KP509_04G106900 [Ceratopteris richardii]|nr:hypothetical protein KP509_04G106900 [Ceratopteris richardii]
MDCSASREPPNTESNLIGDQARQKQKWDNRDSENPQRMAKGDEVCELSRSSFDKKNDEVSPHLKPIATADCGPRKGSKTANELDRESPNNNVSNEKMKVDEPTAGVMNRLPIENKNALFYMCFGTDLGEDVKGVEGLDGTLANGVTMREEFDFSNTNHDIHKSMDHLERFRETKNALLGMGVEDDDESNEGNDVGCSLDSAASSKANLGFSKVTMGMQSGFSKDIDPGFAPCCGEKGTEHSSLNCELEAVTNSADIYRSSDVKKDEPLNDRKLAVVKEGPVNNNSESRIDDDNSLVDRMAGVGSRQPLPKDKHIIGGSLSQISQPKAGQQEEGIIFRSVNGMKNSHGTAMTFKGTALDCKHDLFQQGNHTHANPLNPTLSNIFFSKDLIEPPAGDKDKTERLGMTSDCDTLGMPDGACPSWNMFAASKSGLNHTLQDSRDGQPGYASQSKLGDSILSTGRTADFPGFDPMLGFTSYSRTGAEMMYAYQERANTNPMYFSSLCTNNSVYSTPSNKVMSVQNFPLSTAPLGTSSSRPMLMGMPGHVLGHHEHSNLHMFLGLGMNGVSTASDGVHMFPRIYSQNNQQTSHASCKNTPQSTASLVTQQQNSSVQEKAILELNF